MTLREFELEVGGMIGALYNKLTENLYSAAGLIAFNRIDEARNQLQQLLSELEGEITTIAIKHYLFARALAKRVSLSTAQETNLYFQEFEVSQIEILNLVTNYFSPYCLANYLANGLILEACKGRDEVTIVDIEIGTGKQIEQLFYQLVAAKIVPKQLQVIGVDSSAFNLDLVEEKLHKVASRLGIRLSFTPIYSTIESLGNQWYDLYLLCRDPIVNASFALHHIQDDARNQVLQRLSNLYPSLLVISEPDVDYIEPDFIQKFHNCWSHFSLLFEVVDKLVIAQKYKNALKVSYFGCKIEDVLGKPEDIQTERYESTDSWINRLHASGYKLRSFPTLPQLPTSLIVEVNSRKEYFGINYRNQTLVSVIAAELA